MQKEKTVTYPERINNELYYFKEHIEKPDQNVDPASPVYAAVIYKSRDGRTCGSRMHLDVSMDWNSVEEQILSFINFISKSEDIPYDSIEYVFPSYDVEKPDGIYSESFEVKHREYPEEFDGMLNAFFMDVTADYAHGYGDDTECFADVSYRDFDGSEKTIRFPVDVLSRDAEALLMEQMDQLFEEHQIGYEDILDIHLSYESFWDTAQRLKNEKQKEEQK